MQKHIRDDYKQVLSKIALELDVGRDIDSIFSNFTNAKNFLKIYMIKNEYHMATIDREILYKIRHTELVRLAKTSIFIGKRYGIRFLLLKIKEKIQIIKNSK